MEKILVYGMTDNPGGIETYLINAAQQLSGKVQFDFVTDFPSIAHEEALKKMGSKFYFIPPKGKKLLAHINGMFKILKAHPEYKTVYFNLLDAGGAITELAPWLLRRRIVTHSHNNNTEKVKLHRLCKPFLKLFTSGQVACSAVAADYMFGENNNALIIPNAIEARKFVFNEEIRKSKRRELGLTDELTVCHVGRLSMQKNPFRMLDIMSALTKKIPNAVLLSVGTGELEREVHDYADKIGVSKNVRFLGRRNDVEELLQAADVFFLPSLYEGFGICIIEAEAAGLNCVVSKGIPEEVNITGRVTFVSLDASDDDWAEALASNVSQNRTDCTSYFIESGYDSEHTDTKNRELLKMLTASK